jgi:hypothetical protein
MEMTSNTADCAWQATTDAQHFVDGLEPWEIAHCFVQLHKVATQAKHAAAAVAAAAACKHSTASSRGSCA